MRGDVWRSELLEAAPDVEAYTVHYTGVTSVV